MSRFAAAIAAAASAEPMVPRAMPGGSTVLIDGDGLAYYCAGNDDTEPGRARRNLQDKVQSAVSAVGADRYLILLTGRGSTKGGRYAIARAKPYQAQRVGSRRPKNWEFLRSFMETGLAGPVDITVTQEADDRFRYHSNSLGWDKAVVYSQDKDMRQVPGVHLTWTDHLMVELPPDVFGKTAFDNLYGPAWFWSQMLHGDAADNIPGLPFYVTGELLKSGPKKGEIKQIPCGPGSAAVTLSLPRATSNEEAAALVLGLYDSCYGERGLVALLEQAALLWMQGTEDVLDVVNDGNPCAPLKSDPRFEEACAEIRERTNPCV